MCRKRRSEHGGPEAGRQHCGSEHPTTGSQVERDPADQSEDDGNGRSRLATEVVGHSSSGEQAEGTKTAEEDQEEAGRPCVPLQIVDHALEDEVEGRR